LQLEQLLWVNKADAIHAARDRCCASGTTLSRPSRRRRRQLTSLTTSPASPAGGRCTASSPPLLGWKRRSDQ